MNAPVISDVYTKYRSENLPDTQFFVNALRDSFGVPSDQIDDFITVFNKSLKEAELLEELSGGNYRVLDVTSPGDTSTPAGDEQLRKLSKGVTVGASDTCFVMMPFSDPIGGDHDSLYKPAIEKAKLKPDRADSDIYGTGKIIDQIWEGHHLCPRLVGRAYGPQCERAVRTRSCSRTPQACGPHLRQGQ